MGAHVVEDVVAQAGNSRMKSAEQTLPSTPSSFWWESEGATASTDASAARSSLLGVTLAESTDAAPRMSTEARKTLASAANVAVNRVEVAAKVVAARRRQKDEATS